MRITKKTNFERVKIKQKKICIILKNFFNAVEQQKLSMQNKCLPPLDSQSQCETNVHLHLINFTTSMWFECVTKVPLTWKSKTMGGIFCSLLHSVRRWGSCLSRKAPSKSSRQAGKLVLSVTYWNSRDESHKTRTHLDDPVSCLDAGSHSGSICDKSQSQILNNSARFHFVGLVLTKPQFAPLMLPSTAGWWKNIVKYMRVRVDLPSFTSCINTGLSPLTVSPKPFSSLSIITQRGTRPWQQHRGR